MKPHQLPEKMPQPIDETLTARLNEIVDSTLRQLRFRILLELAGDDPAKKALRDKIENVIYGAASELIVRQSGKAPELHVAFIAESFQNLADAGYLKVEKRPAARPPKRKH